MRAKQETFSIVSLGCFRNAYDAQITAHGLRRRGFAYVPQGTSKKPMMRRCGTLLVNTCGFIDDAKKESIAAIREAVSLKKKKYVQRLVVFGCLVQRYQKELRAHFPEVDEWRGVGTFDCKSAQSRFRFEGSKASEFLKICEGCVNRCSFCAIPLIKGSLQSKLPAAIIDEAKQLADEGVKELNIIGQDITSWGKDLGGRHNLAWLLKAILKATPSIPWIRLIYTHPRHFDDALIELIAGEPRVCKYIDLPIQHIHDRILGAMNRHISRRQIITLINRLRRYMPACAIRSSVIVGFPGETEQEFNDLRAFIQDIHFERLGVFKYSREENTPANNFKKQVHYKTKQQRMDVIMTLQQALSRAWNSRFIGTVVRVLIEARQGNVFVGRTQYDAPSVDGSVFIKRTGLAVGDFYSTTITDAYTYDLVGV